MRLLALGDTHGGATSVFLATMKAVKEDCPIILQLGDYGFWEHTTEGARFLDKVSRILTRNDRQLYFIDGNHDNHPLLWERYPPDDTGFCPVRPNLFYIPRGHSWEWEGTRFLGIGGASSIDFKWRMARELKTHKPGTLWWDTENIRPIDVERAKQARNINIMLCHDVPNRVRHPGIPEPRGDNRFLLQEIAETVLVNDGLIVHGHHHVRYSSQVEWLTPDGWRWFNVEGLGITRHDSTRVIEI